MRLHKYVHLFFIPLIPLNARPHGIRCETCHGDFDDSVLDNQPSQQGAVWECTTCGRTWPETNIRCPICKTRRNAGAVQ
ncbi:MAG: zinc ribbon domain-containing protein [Planctomycetes bacterium]|nr:zinc ribbon domain-containing protein [Planctomycetota bacterium]